MRELRPRLWYWTAPHPEWTPDEGGPDGWERDVGSYAYVSPDEGTLALLDPLVGDDAALDELVERYGPPHVLITIFFHARSAARLLDRHDGARVWAYRPVEAELRKLAPVTDVFDEGDELPAGIVAHPTGGDAHEVAFRLPEYDAVVVGDTLAAAPGAPVRVWGGGERLPELLDRPLELLLLTHGEPVLARGGEAVARALEA